MQTLLSEQSPRAAQLGRPLMLQMMQSQLMGAVAAAAAEPGEPKLPPLTNLVRTTPLTRVPSISCLSELGAIEADMSSNATTPRIMSLSSSPNTVGGAPMLPLRPMTRPDSPMMSAVRSSSPVMSCSSSPQLLRSPSQRLTVLPSINDDPLPRIANLKSGCADGLLLLSVTASLVARDNGSVGMKRSNSNLNCEPRVVEPRASKRARVASAWNAGLRI